MIATMIFITELKYKFQPDCFGTHLSEKFSGNYKRKFVIHNVNFEDGIV